jgi:hypothetical protein
MGLLEDLKMQAHAVSAATMAPMWSVYLGMWFAFILILGVAAAIIWAIAGPSWSQIFG